MRPGQRPILAWDDPLDVFGDKRAQSFSALPEAAAKKSFMSSRRPAALPPR